MSALGKGAGQGFGFALGAVAGFLLVAYLTAKGFDRQLKSVVEQAEAMLAARNEAPTEEDR